MKCALASERRNARDGAAALASLVDEVLLALGIATHALACGAASDALDSGPSHASTTSTTTSTTGTTSTTSASGDSTTVRDDDTPVEELGSGFIPPTDDGWQEECDIWAQDCPVGEKCMPWARSAGSSWNETRCTPVAEDPDDVGESCTVEGYGTSGIDSCELGAMCWDIEPETGLGTCTAMCKGSEAKPVCPGETHCAIFGRGVLILCLTQCDPLVQDCYPGAGCTPINDGFSCVPDASGASGQFGDACEFVNTCDPGLFCANPDAVPSCNDRDGCCNAFCDITMANDCPGTGQQCVAWYEPGMAPPSLERVGACALP